MSNSGKAVFLSYASQDAEAAKRICDALRAAGVEVWFDQSELVGGDQWDAKIRGQISSCALFVPIISANTQARKEGYFRIEWRLAAQRTHAMSDDASFLMPVVVDDTNDAEARVPAEFKAVQWTKLPGGETPPAFCARVQTLLGEDPVGAAIHREYRGGSQTNVALVVQGSSAKLRWVVTGIALAFSVAIGGWYFSKKAPISPANTTTAVEPDSEARKLLQRAGEIIERSGMQRASMDSVSELASRAVLLDPTDEEVLGPAARVDAWIVYMGYDRSTERRQQAQKRAALAMSLAPNSHAARWARAAVFAFADGSPAILAEAEKILRALAAEAGGKSVLTDLGTVLRDENKFSEAAAVFERADDLGSAGWNYLIAGRIDDARRVALAQPRNPSTLNLRFAIEWRGAEDLSALYAIANGLSAEELLNEDLVQWALIIFLARSEPERSIRMLNALPTEFFTSRGYRGPKRYYTGLAYALLGNAEAARIEWHTALNQVRERLKTAANDLDLLSVQARLLAYLDEKEEAERGRRLYVSMAEANAADMEEVAFHNAVTLTELGRNEEAIAALSPAILAKKPGLSGMHADARFTPEFTVLRRDPRFVKLLRDTLPPGAKPFDDPKP
jgi:hypothetical protein